MFQHPTLRLDSIFVFIVLVILFVRSALLIGFSLPCRDLETVTGFVTVMAKLFVTRGGGGV